jgi:hypothetical protein
MTAYVARSLCAVAAATAFVVAGPVTAASATTEPAAAPQGCSEITLALDAIEAFAFSFATGDVETLEALLPRLGEIGSDAVAAAPEDIAETVETWVAPFPLIVAALAEIDLSDEDAFEQAVTAVDFRSSETARGEVEAWAEFNCDWQSSLDVEQIAAAEPPDCETLDAAAAAEAAGIDVDVIDLDGTADVNLPGFWTKSCSYGNGAMSLSTLSFNAIEDAQRFYDQNLDAVGGVVLDVAVGELPDSSLVIQSGGATITTASTPLSSDDEVAVAAPTVQVTVFEAPVPFSVTFTGDDIDPAAVVAAAEAVLAAPATEAEPPTTDVATTV